MSIGRNENISARITSFDENLVYFAFFIMLQPCYHVSVGDYSQNIFLQFSFTCKATQVI